MKASKQKELFPLEDIQRAEKTIKRYPWYYITRWRNSEMLYAWTDDGEPLWCEHDSRGKNGILPHLYNSRHLAERGVRTIGHPVAITKWCYSVGRIQKRR